MQRLQWSLFGLLLVSLAVLGCTKPQVPKTVDELSQAGEPRAARDTPAQSKNPVVPPANNNAVGGAWGTIKGQVVLDGKVPVRAILPINKDQKDCLATKPQLLSEEWVVDPATKGVKWVYVWLMPDSLEKKDLAKPIPIHPNLKANKPANVVIDQPCCMFEPYAIGLVEGQSITVKNSMSIAHNVRIDGDKDLGNPALSEMIPPGSKLDVGPFHPQPTPIPVACNIHGWMTGYIRVFSHPYFAITKENGEFEIKDAPAGKYRLVILHPGSGWVVGDRTPDKFGIQIEINPNATTELKQFKIKSPAT